MLKDDNLGLGAGLRSSDNGEPGPGLNVFQGILGRLNGKTPEALGQEQEVLRDLQRTSYVESRWGPFRFVSGGLLIGEQVEEEPTTLQQGIDSSTVQHKMVKPKRKAFSKRHDHRDVGSGSQLRRDCQAHHATATESSLVRKYPNGKEQGIKTSDIASELREQSDVLESDLCSDGKFPVAGSQAEKRQKKRNKEGKKSRHSPNTKRRLSKGLSRGLPVPQNKALKDRRVPQESQGIRELQDEEEALDARVSGARYAVRQRYIKHKKMATMDSKALHEVIRPRFGKYCDT